MQSGGPFSCPESPATTPSDGAHWPETLLILPTRFGDYAFFLYTTASHTPGHHRYRLVFPLASPVDPDRYGELWAWAHSKLGKSADES